MSDTCFRVDSPTVVHDRFGDEVIAINLHTGTYHSMTGAAADAFVLLAEEATAGELADALAARYAATPGEIAAGLAPFLEQLQKEQLIAAVKARKPRGGLRIAEGKSGLPFAPPILEAFRDLENLLLLDPIHEIGDDGWPHAGDAPTELSKRQSKAK